MQGRRRVAQRLRFVNFLLNVQKAFGLVHQTFTNEFMAPVYILSKVWKTCQTNNFFCFLIH